MKTHYLWGGNFSDWLKARLPMIKHFEPNAIFLGIGNGDRLLAAVAYTNYTGYDLELTIAADSPKWCTRNSVYEILKHPFLTNKCIRVTAKVAKHNKKSRQLVEGVGFKLEGVVRKGMKDDDLCVYGLLYEEALPWLTLKETYHVR